MIVLTTLNGFCGILMELINIFEGLDNEWGMN